MDYLEKFMKDNHLIYRLQLDSTEDITKERDLSSLADEQKTTQSWRLSSIWT